MNGSVKRFIWGTSEIIDTRYDWTASSGDYWLDSTGAFSHSYSLAGCR